LCSYFGYSRSGYYKSLESKTTVALQEDLVIRLVEDIRRYQPRIGGKKLYKLLKTDLDKLKGHMGRDKFFDILRKRKMLVKRRKKYVTTTDSYHRFHKYKNKLKQKLLTGPNQAYVNDITYLRTDEGFVYLFLQTDAWSRKVTGWDLSDNLSIEGAIKALEMTMKQCTKPEGVIHHSDRGIQYCCKEYVEILNRNKMEISMTEENHCYENAIAERVNGILKDEFLLDAKFANKALALRAVKEAIESYNSRRPHWSLNLLTPQQIHQAA
jgi:transposase InsO family protein